MAYRREANLIFKTLRLLGQSQLGYNGRKTVEQVGNAALRSLIAAGPIRRPFDNGDTNGEMYVEVSLV